MAHRHSSADSIVPAEQLTRQEPALHHHVLVIASSHHDSFMQPASHSLLIWFSFTLLSRTKEITISQASLAIIHRYQQHTPERGRAQQSPRVINLFYHVISDQ